MKLDESHGKQSASAVVITLAFLLLVSIIVVGLLDTVRTENVSANSSLNGLQAEFFAQAAVDRVVGTLQEQTSVNSYPWISQPGQLVISDSNSKGTPVQLVPLSSGSAAPAITSDPKLGMRPANLNAPTFRDTTNHLITESIDPATGNVIEIPVAWIYVRKSGAIESATASQPATNNTADPIVGRYAYWTDDESSKINYNLAWGRSSDNTDPIGSPTQIDLTALQTTSGSISGPMANMVRSFILTGTTTGLSGAALMGAAPNQRYYFANTPQDFRRIPDSTVVSILGACKSELTHYNSDPCINFFNEKRIALTTRKANMPKTSGTYLAILKDESADPGDTLNNIDDAKLSATINTLCKYLTRTDWPMLQGTSFEKKYYKNATEGNYHTVQLALNIIEYVRCREAAGNSNGNMVIPLRGNYANQKWTSWVVGSKTDSTAYSSLSRTPCITELSTSLINNRVAVKAEVFSPRGYHLQDIDLSKLWFYAEVSGIKTSGTDNTFNEEKRISSTVNTTADVQKLQPGGYATITHLFPAAISGSDGAKVNVRVALSTGTGGGERLEIIPRLLKYIPMNINGASMEVNDPRVNKNLADWKANPNGQNTFGKQNQRYLASDTGVEIPQQDTDSSGALSDASLYMPEPNGIVASVAELGYIHTGARVFIPGTPWRTLRLQPNSGSSPTLPDWALLDIFNVPNKWSVNAVSCPNGNSCGGRVNLNSSAQPFDFPRYSPLSAVFENSICDSLTSATVSGSARTIAENIYKRLPARNGTLYNFPGGYYSPGEIAEIEGVADKGEPSEELVRQVSNQLTTRGNVFTVYAIGESIKQTPGGELRTTGQRRLQSIVERYIDDPTSQVRCRVIYHKRMSP